MPSLQQLLIVAFILLVGVLVLGLRRRRPLDGSPKQYRREIDAATAQSASVKRDLEQLLVELEGLSRKIDAQIDSKLARLEATISDADKRIMALRILLDEAKKAAEASAAGGMPRDTGAAAATGSPATPDGPGATSGAASQGSAAAAGDRGDTVGRPVATGRVGADARQPLDPAADRRLRIYGLADQGMSPAHIARQLGEPVGEVELILNLRVRDGAAEAVSAAASGASDAPRTTRS